MNFHQCVKTIKTSATVVDAPVAPEKRPELKFSTQVVMTEFRHELKSVLEECRSGKMISAPAKEPDILDESDVGAIVQELLELNQSLFADIPLSDELCRKFLYNIPLEIFNLFASVHNQEIHPVFNPIVLFYIFCTADPEACMGKYLHILTEKLNHPGARCIIDESAMQYDALNHAASDEEEETVEEYEEIDPEDLM